MRTRSGAVFAVVLLALGGMAGEEVDAVLVDALKRKELQGMVIKVLVARGCTDAVPALLGMATAGDQGVRKEAWSGLGSLATVDHVDPILKIIAKIEDDDERRSAEAAIRKVCSLAIDKSACMKAAAGHYDQGNNPTKAILLGLGAFSDDRLALEMERKALASGDPELAGKALRALAAWPNPSAGEDLLRLAKTAAVPADRLVALAGYINLAGLKDRSLKPQKRTDMLRVAAELATRPEEKKLIVGTLRQAVTVESLDMLETFMKDPGLVTEAEMSAADVAWNLRGQHPEKAAAMAEKLKTSKNKHVAGMANKTLKELAKKKKN